MIHRAIIVDLMRNRGSTIRQVEHRIKTHSPTEVGRALFELRDAGKVREMGDSYEVTKEGLNMVWGER